MLGMEMIDVTREQIGGSEERSLVSLCMHWNNMSSPTPAPWVENSAGLGEGSTSLAQGAMWQILNEVELCPPWTGNDLLGLVRLIIHISHPQEKGVLIDFIKHFRCYFPLVILFQDTLKERKKKVLNLNDLIMYIGPTNQLS